jgi:hypothetical protein
LADITTKMSVTGLNEYKRAMNDAKESVKTLDSELKLNEEQLKLNGNAEMYMSNKLALLKKQIEEQKKVVAAAEQALKQMKDNGVDPNSKAYQTMQRNVYQAATKLTSMKTELKAVETGADSATKKTSGMNEELRSVGKGIAWQNVTEGLKDITRQLESGARAAVNFGKKVAKSAMDSTEWADDVLTRATKYGVDAETVQRMDNVAEFIDTDVDTIIAARSRLARNKDSLGDLLGLDANGKTVDEAFWEAGRAIASMSDEWEKEEAAQKVFGRGWKELLPLFTAGQEKYQELMESQSVMSNEQVEKLGKADDAIKSIQQQFDLMKNQFWADNADKIIELMQWIMDNKDGIVTALTVIGGAFAAMKIGEFASNVGKAVNGMKDLLHLGGQSAAASAGSSGGSAAAAGSGSGFLGTAAGAIKDFFIGGAGTQLAVVAAAVAPAIIAQNADYARSEEKRASRVQSAGNANTPDAQFLRKAAEALVLRNGENKDFSGIESLLMGLSARQNQEKAELYNAISTYAPYAGGDFTWNRLQKYWNGEEMDLVQVDELLESVTNAIQAKVDAEGAPKVEVAPEVPDGAAADIASQIGTVPVQVSPQASGLTVPGHANGLPFVPYDGYLSVLHKGERVLPASMNRQYTYNSNTYFGSVNLHNGLEVDALTESIERNNRRKRNGYGAN